MSGSAGLDRIGPAALARPVLALVVLVIVLAATGLGLPRLAFDDDINRVFLSNSALSQSQRALEASFSPPASDVAVLIESDDPIAVADLGRLRDLSFDLELGDGVLSVLSPFALRLPPTDGATPEPLFDDSLNAPALDARLAGFRAGHTGLPLLIRPDRSALMMVVSVDRKPRHRGDRSHPRHSRG